MTIGTAMIALNQFAQIATQKDPITVSKMVIVSSMVNGKYSSIFPRSESYHVRENFVGQEPADNPDGAVSWSLVETNLERIG